MDHFPNLETLDQICDRGELRVGRRRQLPQPDKAFCSVAAGGPCSLLWCCPAAVGPFLSRHPIKLFLCRSRRWPRSSWKTPGFTGSAVGESAEERVPVDARPRVAEPAPPIRNATVMLGQRASLPTRSLDSRHHRPPTNHLIRLVDDLLDSRVSRLRQDSPHARTRRFADRRVAVRRGRSTAARSTQSRVRSRPARDPVHVSGRTRHGTRRCSSSAEQRGEDTEPRGRIWLSVQLNRAPSYSSARHWRRISHELLPAVFDLFTQATARSIALRAGGRWPNARAPLIRCTAAAFTLSDGLGRGSEVRRAASGAADDVTLPSTEPVM